MFKFSNKSKEKLNECHPDLRVILTEAIKHYDLTVLEALRTKETQEEYVRTGRSKTMKSKHLPQADGYSYAVDIALWPIDWDNRERFVFLQGFLRGLAVQLLSQGKISHDIRLGIDWSNSKKGPLMKDKKLFFDGPHIELVISNT